MAQKFLPDDQQVTESPGALSNTSPESIHPGLRDSLIKVPVTPGIHLGEYDSSRPGTGSSGYFTHNPSKPSRLRDGMAQSPTDAASGATSNRDILRRMSLSSAGRSRRDSLSNLDPRAANPTLNLSGGVISATFCIPHSITYRKGKDWVCMPTISLMCIC